MPLFQYRGQSYPVVVVSTSDFVIPTGVTVFFFCISLSALRVWDSVYVTPEGRMVNFVPKEIVAQVFGNKIYVPTFNNTTVPQIIKRGEIVFQVSPVSDYMGAIAYAFSNAKK